MHWAGGLRLLSKALAVKEFSVFESTPAASKKAVFIISGPISGPTKATLQAVLQNSSLEYVLMVDTSS